MKGMILRFPQFKRKRISITDLRYCIKRYGVIIFLTLFLTAGAVWGAVVARTADQEFMNSLNFIFVTDFTAGADQSIFVTFAAALTSYFIFFFVMLLLGLSAWGMAGVPAVLFFKGMGIGLCGGYLYAVYGLQGAGFYLLIMIPGTIISCVALLAQGKEATAFAVAVWHSLRKSSSYGAAKGISLYSYISGSSYILIGTAIAALTDAIMSAAFSGLFSF